MSLSPSFRSPWMLLIPGAILAISALIYISAGAEARDLKQTWETGLKLEIESLQKIIGSRSGENSARAAANPYMFKPVFSEEAASLTRTTDKLSKGAGDFYSGISSEINFFSMMQGICVGFMALSVVLTACSAFGLATRKT